jgi:hypothetical protein
MAAFQCFIKGADVQEIFRTVLGDAGSEAARLAERVDDLTEQLSVAEAQHSLVADWPDGRIALLRSALRQDRFADVAGYTAELERAEAELSAVQELRRRLAGEHT